MATKKLPDLRSGNHKKTKRTVLPLLEVAPREQRTQPVAWKALLESWSLEFSSRCDRVRNLIGHAHWPTDGAHKEALIRSFLCERLPVRAAVEQGFLLNPRTNEVSSQLDIFIRDTQHSAPFLKESGITICDPNAVLGAIEVKSSFTSTSLNEALSSLSGIASTLGNSATPRPWSAVFFAACTSTRSDDSVLRTLEEQIKHLYTSRRDASVPTCVICADKFCCFTSPDAENKKTKIRYFPAGRLSFALAAIDLLSHVYAVLGSPGFQPFDEGVDQMLPVSPLVRVI